MLCETPASTGGPERAFQIAADVGR